MSGASSSSQYQAGPIGALSTLSTVLPLPPRPRRREISTASTVGQNGQTSLLERRAGSATFRKFKLALDTKQARSDAEHDDVNTVELPPSPTGLPGSWTWYSDDHGDSALLLPPPFLDHLSSRESFEGVLGTRAARQAAIKARKEAMMWARDRPPPRPFPASLVTTASKLMNALGPPGGLDSGASYRKWQRKSTSDGAEEAAKIAPPGLKRAQSGLKGRELGDKFASRLVQKLRREQIRRELEGDDVPPLEIDEMQATDDVVPASAPMTVLTAATPASLFSAPTATSTIKTTLSPSPLFSPVEFAPSHSAPAAEEADFDGPPKPRLVPFVSEAEPSPFPDSFDNSSEVEDYFGRRKASLRRRRVQRPVEEAAESSHTPEITRKVSTASLRSQRSLSQVSIHRWTDARKRFVAFFTWCLIGSPSPSSPYDYGGLAYVFVFLFGFVVFLLVHTGSLVLSFASTLRSTWIFASWVFLNVTGRTDLSQVFRSYFQLCKAEWEQVFQDDEVRLGVWSVTVGLLEVAAIQAMSKVRWLIEGPGELKLLNDDDDESKQALSTSPGKSKSPRSPRKRKRLSRGMSGMAGEQMIVTGKQDSVMEATLFDPQVHLSSTSPYSLVPKEMSMAVTPLDLGSSAFPGFSLSPVAGTDTGRMTRLPSLTTTSPPLYPLPEMDAVSTLISTIQRHARLATASYGLHSYIVAPPTPLFTPSGATLPQRVFGHLGGIDQKNVLHVAIQDDYRDPGTLAAGADDETSDYDYSPQFYLLRDDTNAEVVCVIRGTQSLADIRVDLEAATARVELVDGQGTKTSYHAHAGIVAAARRLLDPQTSPLYAKLLATLEENPSYSLVFTGHSLGGAIASTLAFLISELRDSDQRWVVAANHGLPAGRFVRAYCFAHPTTVDLALSKRCAQGSEPLVLSVSYASDVVVRMGVTQVREVRRALGRLEQRRRRTFHPKAQGEHGKSEILRTWWKWKQLQSKLADEKQKPADQVAEEAKRIEDKAWQWRQEIERAIEADVQSDVSKRQEALFMVPAGKCLHVDSLPRELEQKRREAMKRDDDERQDDEEAESEPMYGLYEVGNPRAFFACPHLEADAVAAHLPAVYLAAIDAL